MNRRTLPDRETLEAALRARLLMAKIEIEAAVEFYDQTDRYFRKKIDEWERKNAAHSAAYWEEDLGGITRGDLESERGLELRDKLRLNSYFGILNIFGSFERLLLRIFQDMKQSKRMKDKWQKRQPYLTIDGYKDCLKAIGINLTKSPFKWGEIIKLQAFRNAIAHQNGFVTEENVNRLRAYGYKLDQMIEIKETYFRTSVELVNDSSSRLVKEYGRTLQKKTKR
ncbi:MAG TPA: hypothetical protein VMG31_05765 [Verrucomicrobiae bacterium]|nr:hypothetical protein [Verrucomicrobiae bacterium]